MWAGEPRPVPLLVRARDHQLGSDNAVLDEFGFGLAVAYAVSAPYDSHLLSWPQLRQSGWSQRMLRQTALETLVRRLGDVRLYGQPPVLMVSFHGIESSLLLLDSIWEDVARTVPGELVVAAPARDVVFLTGSELPQGLARIRRAVDRVFLARQAHPLGDEVFVRRGRCWQSVQADLRRSA